MLVEGLEDRVIRINCRGYLCEHVLGDLKKRGGWCLVLLGNWGCVEERFWSLISALMFSSDEFALGGLCAWFCAAWLFGLRAFLLHALHWYAMGWLFLSLDLLACVFDRTWSAYSSSITYNTTGNHWFAVPLIPSHLVSSSLMSWLCLIKRSCLFDLICRDWICKWGFLDRWIDG